MTAAPTRMPDATAAEELQAVRAIQRTFPGAASVLDDGTTEAGEPAVGIDPRLRGQPVPTPAPAKPRPPRLSSNVAELCKAVDEMLTYFEREEPGRTTRGGWQRIRDALQAVREDRQIDPTEVGGGAVGLEHPHVSQRAAAVVHRGTQLFAALEALDDADDGLTAWELTQHPVMVAVRPDLPPNQASIRLGELRERGLAEKAVDDAGQVRTRTAAASEAEVHQITAAGAAELYRLLDEAEKS